MVVLDAGGELGKCKGRSITLFLLNDLLLVARVRRGLPSSSSGGSLAQNLATPTTGTSPTRQMAHFNSVGSMQRVRKPYQYITNLLFSGIQSVQVERSVAVFVLICRDVWG